MCHVQWGWVQLYQVMHFEFQYYKFHLFSFDAIKFIELVFTGASMRFYACEDTGSAVWLMTTVSNMWRTWRCSAFVAFTANILFIRMFIRKLCVNKVIWNFLGPLFTRYIEIFCNVFHMDLCNTIRILLWISLSWYPHFCCLYKSHLWTSYKHL